MKTKKNKESKMAKPKTYVTLILDQSGSMCTTKEEAVKGYNEQVQQMKINSKDQDIFCSLITFNGDVFEHLWCEPAEKLTEASAEDYQTAGLTAMRDAVGYAIEKLQRTVGSEGDVAHLVVIVSDGDENTSRHYSVEALRELKESVDKTGKWTFTYMGCDEKYLKRVAAEMNIPISNVAKWSNATSELAGRGMHHNAVKMKGFYGARARGQTCNKNVYSDVNCLADFTSEDAVDEVPATPVGVCGGPMDPSHPAWKATPLHPSLNMNILDDGHKVVCSTGTSPFKNNAPVAWNG